MILRKSIEGMNVKKDHRLYYTYLIVNGSALEEMYSDFENLDLVKSKPTTKHFVIFKKRTVYAGKGIDTRSISHVINGKKIKLKRLKRTKISAKYSKICNIWDKGEGVSVIKLFYECNQYEALSREYAIIKALGLNNLTNVISGTCYGAMRNLSDTEVINFGNMILMKSLEDIINDKPVIIKENDVCIPKSKKQNNLLCKWEIEGMIQCLVDL